MSNDIPAVSRRVLGYQYDWHGFLNLLRAFACQSFPARSVRSGLSPSLHRHRHVLLPKDRVYLGNCHVLLAERNRYVSGLTVSQPLVKIADHSLVANIFGSFLAWAVSFADQSHLYVYQILFLIVGLMTVLTVPYIIWKLDNSPATARFLTPQERLWAVERLRDNNTGIENSESLLVSKGRATR